MVPEHRVEQLRDMAHEDGRESAMDGEERDGGGWMSGTIFYDDWCDGFDAVTEGQLLACPVAQTPKGTNP